MKTLERMKITNVHLLDMINCCRFQRWYFKHFPKDVLMAIFDFKGTVFVELEDEMTADQTRGRKGVKSLKFLIFHKLC